MMNTVFICSAMIISGLFLFMWKEAYRNKIKVDYLQFTQLPAAFDHFRLFFISDIHRRIIPDKVIDKLQGKVDLVIIGGDLCEKGVPIKRVDQNLAKLRSLAPTVFVWGNNDEEIGAENVRSSLKKYRITELNNKSEIIKRSSDQIVISGVDDLGHCRDRIEEVMSEDIQPFSILISHYPDIIYKLPCNHPFSLVLSGHTHGGQIRFFGWGLRPKGKLMHNERYIHLISNGFGTTGVPLRLGARAEMHLLILKK